MSRCDYLDYESGGFFSSTFDKYHCKLSGKTFEPGRYSADNSQVEYTCKKDCEHCEIYKKR